MIRTTSVTLGIGVGDLDAAVAWYGRLLEEPEVVRPVDGVVEYELRPGVWLQLAEDDVVSQAVVIRLGVKDLDATREALVAAGVAVDEIERIPGVIAYADLVDPWGNRLGLYEVDHDLRD